MLLFIVEKAFLVKGKGFLLHPGPDDKVAKISIGARIKLIRPDQSELITTVKGIAFEGDHSLLISTNQPIPAGTEVWVLENL